MHRKKHKLIHIPVLNDFIYTILYNASFQEKRGLKGRYLKAAMSERAAKYFAENSSKEEKEYILTYFGYSYCYVIYKKDDGFEKIREIIEERRPNIERIKGMSEAGIYLHSDLEFQRYLGLTAHALHHHNFQFNNEIVRAHYHIQKWSKIYHSPTDIQSREVDESVRQTAKFLFNALSGMDNLTTLIGVNIQGLTLLLYFYQLRERSVPRSQLAAIFAGYYTPNIMKRILKDLSEGNYISSIRVHTDEEGKRPWHYSITSIGIKAVNNYFQHVYNKNSF